MSEITYEGRTYYEPDFGAQKALCEAGISTFRYYFDEKLMICTDYFVKQFHCPKFIPNMPQGIADTLIDERDWPDLFAMNTAIQDGRVRVSRILHSKDGAVNRVTVSVLERDEEGNAKACIGLVENQEEDLRMVGIINALSGDYHSVFYVDVDSDTIYPYRLNGVIEEEFGEFFRSEPSYEMAITAYILHDVVDEEKQEMLSLCSLKNLTSRFEINNIYTHDYRAVYNDRISYCRMKAVNISHEPGLHEMVLGFADISNDKKREIERYAYMDTLTGGDNYNRFRENVVVGNMPGYIVSMDLYAFKTVNVACGTARGDEALRGVYGCIRRHLSSGDLTGHINADHFAIFFATEDQDRVEEQLRRISLDTEKLCGELSVPRLIPYYGASLWRPEQGVEMVYGEANTAKHEAKHRKDVNLCFYTAASSERMMRKKAMEDSFDQAIANGEFEVWLQGQYDPADGQIRGAEALSRWRKPDGVLVPPSEFIPVYEKNGMIRQLDAYVFRNVCKMQKNRIDAGKPYIPISVNLSRASMYYRNVVNDYKNIAAEVGIDPKLVPIEITESATVDNNEIAALAEEFYEAGFRLHLDDFGTGYSSLATLNVFRFDTLKLDKSLIDYIHSGKGNGDKLIRHTIALAKDMGMKVVAEGVEQEEQVGFLKEQNCDMIQGFYYAKPMPVKEFEKYNEYQG